MSRVGKMPIKLPSGVKANLREGAVFIEGPKGKMNQTVPAGLEIKLEKDEVLVSCQNGEQQTRSNFGTYRSLIYNMVHGVSEGFKKELELIGVGYRASVSGKNLELALGYSHPIRFPIPQGIEIKVEKTRITVSGADKRLVGFVSARIREYRAPEPYKGKGIRYVGERVRRKVGKAAVGSTSA